MNKDWFVYKLLAAYVHKAMVSINPRREMERIYKKVFHKKPDIEHPHDLIEKIYWLQLHSDTSLWTKCADKYLVRDYVKECGLEEYLPRFYGRWDKAGDIPFGTLPAKYILKTNNGCGTCFIVKDGIIDKKSVVKTIDQWMKVPYGYSGAQLHYTKIRPCIIAEELLENDKEAMTISPNCVIDYKVWCFNGEPECILLVFNRNGHYANLALYDTEWNGISNNLVETKLKTYNPNITIKKPACLAKVLDMARKLSEPFKEVRVDFYIINDRPYIGELTFTSGFGYFTEEYYKYLGSKFEVGIPQE